MPTAALSDNAQACPLVCIREHSDNAPPAAHKQTTDLASCMTLIFAAPCCNHLLSTACNFAVVGTRMLPPGLGSTWCQRACLCTSYFTTCTTALSCGSSQSASGQNGGIAKMDHVDAKRVPWLQTQLPKVGAWRSRTSVSGRESELSGEPVRPARNFCLSVMVRGAVLLR